MVTLLRFEFRLIRYLFYIEKRPRRHWAIQRKWSQERRTTKKTLKNGVISQANGLIQNSEHQKSSPFRQKQLKYQIIKELNCTYFMRNYYFLFCNLNNLKITQIIIGGNLINLYLFNESLSNKHAIKIIKMEFYG